MPDGVTPWCLHLVPVILSRAEKNTSSRDITATFIKLNLEDKLNKI